MECRTGGMSHWWNVAAMECRSSRMSQQWNVAVVEYRSGRMSQWNRAAVVRSIDGYHRFGWVSSWLFFFSITFLRFLCSIQLPLQLGVEMEKGFVHTRCCFCAGRTLIVFGVPYCQMAQQS